MASSSAQQPPVPNLIGALNQLGPEGIHSLFNLLAQLQGVDITQIPSLGSSPAQVSGTTTNKIPSAPEARPDATGMLSAPEEPVRPLAPSILSNFTNLCLDNVENIQPPTPHPNVAAMVFNAPHDESLPPLPISGEDWGPVITFHALLTDRCPPKVAEVLSCVPAAPAPVAQPKPVLPVSPSPQCSPSEPVSPPTAVSPILSHDELPIANNFSPQPTPPPPPRRRVQPRPLDPTLDYGPGTAVDYVLELMHVRDSDEMKKIYGELLVLWMQNQPSVPDIKKRIDLALGAGEMRAALEYQAALSDITSAALKAYLGRQSRHILWRYVQRKRKVVLGQFKRSWLSEPFTPPLHKIHVEIPHDDDDIHGAGGGPPSASNTSSSQSPAPVENTTVNTSASPTGSKFSSVGTVSPPAGKGRARSRKRTRSTSPGGSVSDTSVSLPEHEVRALLDGANGEDCDTTGDRNGPRLQPILPSDGESAASPWMVPGWSFYGHALGHKNAPVDKVFRDVLKNAPAPGFCSGRLGKAGLRQSVYAETTPFPPNCNLGYHFTVDKWEEIMEATDARRQEDNRFQGPLPTNSQLQARREGKILCSSLYYVTDSGLQPGDMQKKRFCTASGGFMRNPPNTIVMQWGKRSIGPPSGSETSEFSSSPTLSGILKLAHT
jgi:hypothetical protein